jgi:hypothetical protein
MIILRRIVLVSALAAVVCGCSQPGSSPSPAAGVLPAVKNVKIEEFSDLPGNDGYYFPMALTVGSDGRLWIADDADQDYGESVVARVATSGKLIGSDGHRARARPQYVVRRNLVR